MYARDLNLVSYIRLTPLLDEVYANINQAKFLYSQITGAVAGNGSLAEFYILRE